MKNVIMAIAITALLVEAAVSQVKPDSFTGWYSVKSFGAMGDGFHNDTAAFQAAIAQLCSNPIFGQLSRTLYVPPGIYRVAPLRIACQSFHIIGAGKDVSILKSTARNGILLVMPPQPAVPYIPALATGSGSALQLDSKGWFGLMDALQPRWNQQPNWANGLGQFSIELYVNDPSPGQGGTITGSQGDPFPHDPVTSWPAFGLGVTTNDNLECYLNLGNAFTRATAPANTLTPGTHFVSCDYDGTALRLFQDGVLMASRAATGTITQPIGQNMTLGYPARFMDGGGFNAACNCTVDSVRISSTARHTSAYTPPTAKLTGDSSTLALYNFDDQSACDVCTVVHTNMGDGISWFRHVDNGQMGPFYLNDIQIEGSVVVSGAPASVIKDVNIYSGSPFGLYLFQNDYVSTLERINIQNPLTNCLFDLGISGGGQGPNLYSHINLQYCAVQVSANADMSGEWEDPFFSMNSTTRYGLLAVAAKSGDQFTFNQATFSTEGGVKPGVFIANLGSLASMNVIFNGGTFESFGTGGTPIGILDSPRSLLFLNSQSAFGTPLPSHMFQFYAPSPQGVNSINFTDENLSSLPPFSN